MNEQQFTNHSIIAKGFVPDGRGGWHKPKNRGQAPQPEPKRHDQRPPNEVGAPQAQNPRRYLVRITCYRLRLLDKDNLYGGCKFFVDALRYARIVREDDPEAIDLQISQVKVKSEDLERVEIEISPIV